MKEKIPLSHEFVLSQMLDSETSKSIFEVSKSNSSKLLLSRILSYFRVSRFSHYKTSSAGGGGQGNQIEGDTNET